MNTKIVRGEAPNDTILFMASNFLGDVGVARRRSAIVSAAELIAREGVNIQKGMNFRDKGPLLSVLLVLARSEGFRDQWHPDTDTYEYHGHDSTTQEGEHLDQVLMYEGGRLSDNGKFYKAAHDFKSGVRADALQVQVYEKLGPGVWFDKGIFNILNAAHISEHGRKVFKFDLQPLRSGSARVDEAERMISAATKAAVWQRDDGRCTACRSEMDLYFIGNGGAESTRLACTEHGGREKSGLL